MKGRSYYRKGEVQQETANYKNKNAPVTVHAGEVYLLADNL